MQPMHEHMQMMLTDEIWTISSLYNAFPNDSHEFVAKLLRLHEFDNRKPSLRK